MFSNVGYFCNETRTFAAPMVYRLDTGRALDPLVCGAQLTFVLWQ
jgi:hypothetical protein